MNFGECPFNSLMNYLSNTLVATTLILAGMTGSAGFGYYLAKQVPAVPSGDGLRLKDTGYTFISPLLDYQQGGNSLLRRDIQEMQEKINTLIDDAVATGNVSEASLYYRDLENGPVLFINDEVYTPASLLKVPIMIAYFKAAEANPDILNQVVDYKDPLPTVPSQIYIDSTPEIQPGNSYTIGELIDRMITRSDNTAALLLHNYIDINLQQKVYDDFDIPLPNNDDPRRPFINAQTYSGFLRILYNATYLSKEYSEKALEILSRSTFNQGLRAGIPADVKISNKFGVFAKGSEPDIKTQLHDCGIVYSRKTYIICVMSIGHSLEAQAELIKNISAVIYEDNQKNTDN